MSMTNLLCFWSPQSKELINFSSPELQELYDCECLRASVPCQELKWEALCSGAEGVRLDWVSGASLAELQKAAQRSALLTALVEVRLSHASLAFTPRLPVLFVAEACMRNCSRQPLSLLQVSADASSLEAAIAQLELSCGRGALVHCPLRTLALGSSHSKASAERHLRHQLLELLRTLGPAKLPLPGTSPLRSGSLSTAATSSGSGSLPTVWAIQMEGDASKSASETTPIASCEAAGAASRPSRVLLGFELARGGARLAEQHALHAAVRAVRGPTQMRLQLAQATVHLAGLRQGAVVLDPFCGSGALLEEAAACGARFCLGSDLGLECSSVAAGWRDLLAADAGRLRLQSGCLDAVICDIPYGYRASAVVSASAGMAVAGANGMAATVAGDSSRVPGAGTVAGNGPNVPGECSTAAGPGAGDRHGSRDSGGAIPATAAEQAQQGGSTPAWRQLLASLLQLGGYALAPGGRLVAWLPHEGESGCITPPISPAATDCKSGAAGAHEIELNLSCRPAQEVSRNCAGAAAGSGDSTAALEGGVASAEGPSWLGQLGAGQGLALKYYLSETRKSGFPRAVVVFQKGTREGAAGTAARSANKLPPQLGQGLQQQQPQQRQQLAQGQLLSKHASCQGHAVSSQLPDGAAAGEAAQHGSEQPQPPLRTTLWRDTRYSEARSALQGRDIDVWRASWLGDTAAVRSYLEAGGDPNALDSKGQTALQFAAGYGKVPVVQALLEGGADCGLAQDRGRMAPLHRAAARGHAAVVSLLLEHGADPRQGSAVGQTPCHYAAQFGHRPALAVLLHPRWHAASGVPSEQRIAAQASASSAVAAEQHEAGDVLVGGPAQHAGASGEMDSCAGLRAYVALPDGGGLTALHLAAQWGMADAAEDLMLGPPALPCAQEYRQPAAPVPACPAQLLSDANCRTADSEGLTPAHLAARWGHVGVLRVLQRHGADLELPCAGRRRTPLQEAQEWSRPACVEFLGAGGAMMKAERGCS